MDQLETLEQRVGQKWAAAVAARIPHLDMPDDPFDFSDWLTGDPVPEPVLEFPREQWATYPAKRTVTLLLCDKLLDKADDLTDEQWMMVGLAMQYGGKTRLS